MVNLTFDSYAFINNLKAGGFQEDQARALVENLRKVEVPDAAKKDEVADLRSELREFRAEMAVFRAEMARDIMAVHDTLAREIAAQNLKFTEEMAKLRHEMNQELGGLRREMHQELGKFRNELTRETGRLDASIASAKADIFKWIFPILIAQVSGMMFMIFKIYL
jgi:hypothetical protein